MTYYLREVVLIIFESSGATCFTYYVRRYAVHFVYKFPLLFTRYRLRPQAQPPLLAPRPALLVLQVWICVAQRVAAEGSFLSFRCMLFVQEGCVGRGQVLVLLALR